MSKLIDLSQEIFPGMPVFNGHPEVEIVPAETHEGRGRYRQSENRLPRC